MGGPRRGCRIEILDRSANTDGPQVSDRLILRKLKLQRCRCAFRRTTCAAVKSANDGPFLPPLRVILVDWRGAIIRPRYRPRGSTARVGVLNDRYFFPSRSGRLDLLHALAVVHPILRSSCRSQHFLYAPPPLCIVKTAAPRQ